jgi:putative membrane protein
MSVDHAKAGDELKALATAKSVKLPGEPSLVQKVKLKALGAMNGERFDKQYADTIAVGAHEDTVKLFRKAASDAKDPDVKAFATKTLPTLEHHLEMARGLKQTVAKNNK